MEKHYNFKQRHIYQYKWHWRTNLMWMHFWGESKTCCFAYVSWISDKEVSLFSLLWACTIFMLAFPLASSYFVFVYMCVCENFLFSAVWIQDNHMPLPKTFSFTCSSTTHKQVLSPASTINFQVSYISCIQIVFPIILWYYGL